MTNEKMNALFEEAMENLGFDGYVIPDGLNPVPSLNRRKKAYGLCSRKYNQRKQRFDYTVSFSKYFIAGCTEKQFMTVAYHELIHCLYFTDGHTGMWKVTAENGKEVVAANSIASNRVEYVLRCKKCGKLITRHRMGKVIQFPELYRHEMDNGELERIK